MIDAFGGDHFGQTDWNGGHGKVSVFTRRKAGEPRIGVRVAHELIHWSRMYSEGKEDMPLWMSYQVTAWDPVPPGGPSSSLLPVAGWDVDEMIAQWASYYLDTVLVEWE